MNAYVDSLREALENYRTELKALEKNRKPLDGIFGTGSSVKTNACHERFDGAVEAVMTRLREEGASGDEIGEAAAFVLDAAEPGGAMNSLELYLVAAQRHCLPLIGLIPPEQAASLAQRYERRWPRRFRLPVQTEILKALKARGKE